MFARGVSSFGDIHIPLLGQLRMTFVADDVTLTLGRVDGSQFDLHPRPPRPGVSPSIFGLAAGEDEQNEVNGTAQGVSKES